MVFCQNTTLWNWGKTFTFISKNLATFQQILGKEIFKKNIFEWFGRQIFLWAVIFLEVFTLVTSGHERVKIDLSVFKSKVILDRISWNKYEWYFYPMILINRGQSNEIVGIAFLFSEQSVR